MRLYYGTIDALSGDTIRESNFVQATIFKSVRNKKRIEIFFFEEFPRLKLRLLGGFTHILKI